MYNSNNFTLANSIFDINNHKNYLKEEEKSKDKFEGMINAAVNFGAINNNPAVARYQVHETKTSL